MSFGPSVGEPGYLPYCGPCPRLVRMVRKEQCFECPSCGLRTRIINGEAASFEWSREPDNDRHVNDWEAEGRRIALEGMDLPDGAYCAMAEELGLEPY